MHLTRVENSDTSSYFSVLENGENGLGDVGADGGNGRLHFLT